jgi:hypothetical protein
VILLSLAVKRGERQEDLKEDERRELNNSRLIDMTGVIL